MDFTFQFENSLEWNYDKKILNKAEANKPELFKERVEPVSLVDILPDENFVNGVKSVATDTEVNNLSSYHLGKGQSIILDLGDHYVGRFSISMNSVGSPMDAPLYLRLKFAEVPAEIMTNADDYNGWLSKSWFQEEYVHVDVLPAVLELPRRYSCRYIELSVIDTSLKWKVSFNDPKFISQSAVSMNSLADVAIEDTDLQKIHDISVKTLQDCMQFVYEDGPKQDRRLWIGDLRLRH